MPKFIPLSTFKTLYEESAKLLTSEGMSEFMDALNEKGQTIALEAGFAPEDFHHFHQTIQDPSNVLFHGWVERYDGLTDVLSDKKEFALFEDKPRYLEHRFSDQFKHFISPQLANALIAHAGCSGERLTHAFSYVQLLDTDHRAVVEDQLFSWIKSELDALKKQAKESENEQELVNRVKPLCSDEIIQSVNFLSKASYARKLLYVDSILAVIRTKSCTVRFANWILKQMELVSLNREHEHKITDLRKELREGALQVRNHGKGRTPIQWRALLTIILILAIGGFTFYLIYYKPFSEVHDPEIISNSSFSDFSKDDRKKIDSLLKEIDHSFEPRTIDIDPTMPINGGSAMLSLRQEFRNPTMERIYEDLIKDADIKVNYPIDSCYQVNELTEFKRNGGVRDLSKKIGTEQAALRNESDYEIIVLVSEDRSGGAVHSQLVKPGETITFGLDRGNTLLVVAGNNYQNFDAPQGVKSDELPSNAFNYHFCDTDLNYRETINTPYRVASLKKGKTKFMVTGSRNGYVHLIDINQVLTDY